MAFNGSGTYNLPAGNPVVTGTTISSSTTNTTNSDIATALTNCITRDGQSTPSANLPMNAKKLTGLAAGTSAGDSVRYEQVVLSGAALGTPSSGTLTNCTGLPLTTGVTGTLPVANGGTGVTTSTGSGNNVLSASPTLTGVVTINSGQLLGSRGSGNVASNLAIGDNALIFNTIGSNNTALGYYSLFTNVTGSSNTAIGNSALTANTGSNNTAIGDSALISNVGGTLNTAVGWKSAYLNSSGTQNTAIGVDALYNNTTNSYNTAVGYRALYSNRNGEHNVAVGRLALSALYNDGSNNTSIGNSSLLGNTTGNQNTAVGFWALSTNTSGSYNTGLGFQASCGSTGSGNISIGPLNSSGTNAPAFAISTESDRISMGSTGVTNAYVQVAWTVVSDARDKTNFAPVPHGLDFVNKLSPTAYQFKESRESDVPTGIVRYGFKAQDILALEGDTPVIIDNENVEKLRFNSDSLIPVLVNAIKELTARLETLENKVK